MPEANFQIQLLEKKEKSFNDNDGHVPLWKIFQYFMLLTYLLTYAAPIIII